MAEDSSSNAAQTVPSTQASDSRPTRPAHWFKPGNVANPYGNTAPLRSFAAHIRHETGMGREIAAFYLAIMRGEPIKMPEKLIRRGPKGRKLIATAYVRPTLDQRIDAAAWLADRGWGKAKETIELTGEASPAQRLELLRRLSEDEREQLRSLLQRALESNATAIPAISNSSQAGSGLLQMPDSVDSEPVSEVPENPTE